MTYYILCTITYIISYPVPISCLLSCSGYTPMLYFSFFIFVLVLSYTFILYAFIMYFSYTVILYYSYTSIHLYVLIISYTLCFRILSVLFLYWFNTNTFISYLYFSYYVNFYLIFPISRRSIRLILLLSYHILSYVFIYVFMCFHILYFSYTFLFSLLSALYLFISFSCTTLCTFYILYSCTVHVLFSYTYIHVLFISYTVFLLYF